SSLHSLRVLRRNAPGPSTLVVRADLQHLPFAAGTFDKVLCANALQQLQTEPSRRRCVAELARVTRPEGRAVVTAHSYSRPKRRAGWAKEGRGGSCSGAVRYLHPFGDEELRQLLSRVLEVERLTGAGFPLPYRLKLSWLSRRVG